MTLALAVLHRMFGFVLAQYANRCLWANKLRNDLLAFFHKIIQTEAGKGLNPVTHVL